MPTPYFSVAKETVTFLIQFISRATKDSIFYHNIILLGFLPLEFHDDL